MCVEIRFEATTDMLAGAMVVAANDDEAPDWIEDEDGWEILGTAATRLVSHLALVRC